MYRRLSAEARKIVERAESCAGELGQEYIGTEHVLLALVADTDHAVGKALAERGVQAPAVRKAVEDLVRPQVSDDVVLGHLPISPHLTKVMQAAIERAETLNVGKVAAEHLLLAIIREHGSVARAALDDLGVDLDALEKELLV